MEIHKPKPIHGWRTFAGEVGIIVLGVLIALVAEQLVRSIEWRHKVHAAEEAMTAELTTDDGPQAYARRAADPCIRAALDGIRDSIERRLPRAEVIARIKRYDVPFWTWDQFAYQAMIASDLTAHIPAERLQRWTSAYAVVPALDRVNAREFNDGADLVSLGRVGGALSDNERDRLLHAVEVARRDNAAMMAGLRVMIPAMEAVGVRLDAKTKAVVRKYGAGNAGCAPTSAPAGPSR